MEQSIADAVCQVAIPPETPMQQVLGVNCTVADHECTCSWKLLKGAKWHFITTDLNATLGHLAQPGEWYITDPSGHCVASVGTWQLLPEPEECPPGFYCEGGLNPPRSCGSGDYCPGATSKEGRRCPSGSFCPLPAGPKVPCPDGGLCTRGSTKPGACAVGTWCRGGQSGICPRGSYCPFGTVNPIPCSKLSLCPPGSHFQDVTIPAALFLMMCCGLAYLGTRYYHQLLRSGFWVAFVCGAAVGVLYFVDVVLAGFLSLLFFSVAANWFVLHTGVCPPSTGQILVGFTAFTSLLLLWMVNPPWSLLSAGLLYCLCLGWLMSRQLFKIVLCGRVLLCATFVLLLIVYGGVDPTFLTQFTSVLVVSACALVVHWFVEHYQQRPVALPFVTRWRWDLSTSSVPPAMSEELCSSSYPQGDLSEITTTAAASRVSTALPSRMGSGAGLDFERFAASVTDTVPPAVGSGSSPGPVGSSVPADDGSPMSARRSTLGVSFTLKGVSFALPGGKRLLQDNSFVIRPGRRVAVMGPSGSGKSTLLAVLSGRASYGRVVGQLLVCNREAGDLRFLQRVTGYVPQDDILHGELTVRENVRCQAALRLPAGTNDVEIDKRVQEVVADLNLKAIQHERVGTPEKRGVSGGQRKRVSIAMELVSQPQLLFADEPTSGLDSTTSHEVVVCLNNAAAKLGTTVIAVIHQPRFETLTLFDDLILLGVGGLLTYAGPVTETVDHFKRNLRTHFPVNTNPADVVLDAIQPPNATPEDCAAVWLAKGSAAQPWNHQPGDGVSEMVQEALRLRLRRERPPFFCSVLVYMDRSMLQTLRAQSSLMMNQGLLVGTTAVLCFIIQYRRFDEFIMQSAFAALFVMLLQGAASQRIFGADLLVTWREAQVGMPMMAYFVAKDLAALFEVTLSAAVFTAAYSACSGTQILLKTLFAGTWAYIYTVFGLNYIFSIVLSAGPAQMAAVVSAFVSFCVSGVYQPQLPQMAVMFHGRGWMIPALSPVRWFFGYLLTSEVQHLTPLARDLFRSNLHAKGYDTRYLAECTESPLGISDRSILSMREAWLSGRGWVCSVSQMLLLGLMFRFLAGVCLVLYVFGHTSGWARFFGQSEAGAWKLAGRLFMLLVGAFLALFFFAELWIFGILHLPASVDDELHPVAFKVSDMSWSYTADAAQAQASFFGP